jgi:polysaccharide biosynthesis/export protein
MMNRAIRHHLLSTLVTILLATSFTVSAQRPMYKLGPGDNVTMYVIGRPETKTEDIPIAPDGTVTYLDVRVRIAGLTIPEAGKAVETALQKLDTNAKVVLSPGALGSKSYTILGSVPKQGRFNIERSISLLEAIAKAGGLSKEDTQAGAVNARVNLDQSFIVRQGRKLAVDFTKLYSDGDTSQNIGLQHQDHIYIASNLSDEYYVFGYVNNQGMHRARPGLGVVGAITEQAGFAQEAWKGKVLLVRGKMDKPETIAVDIAAVLKAEQADVPIKPGDMLYIHRKPWYHAETILDSAFTAFLRSVAITKVDLESGIE